MKTIIDKKGCRTEPGTPGLVVNGLIEMNGVDVAELLEKFQTKHAENKGKIVELIEKFTALDMQLNIFQQETKELKVLVNELMTQVSQLTRSDSKHEEETKPEQPAPKPPSKPKKENKTQPI